jgi:PAS domain S-box-containing protein
VSDESSFLRQALDEALRLTGSRIGFFYQVHDDQQTCELIASSGESACSAMDSGGNTCQLDSAGLWAACAREHCGLIFNDCASAGGSSSVQVVSGEPARLMAVPLIRDELVRAIVWVGDKIAPYDQDDLEFLQILAADTWRIVQKRRADIELRDALRVVEASPVVSFRWRAEPGWPVDYVSKNVSRWGWSASDLMAGKPAFVDLVHPDDLAKVAEEVMQHTAAGDVEYGQEYRLRAADGRYFWVEDSTRVLRDEAGIVRFYEGVVTDVDADKCREHDLAASLEAQRALNQKLESAQSQLLQSEKMASIGQLAAGVAHEINNPIGFVNSNFGTLSTYLRELFEILDICEASAATAANPADFEMMHAAKAARDFDYLRQDIGQLIEESKDGLERVRKIVQDLKDFSRVGEVEWQWADINQGLDATLNIVWNELKYHCTVNRQFGSLPRIYCLPSQLNQVFMNLLVNAGQAIEGKGEITITTECLGADTVQVRIQDTGRGIPPENINRIFDPFFTTKPVGKGTGLGLSLAWSIVKRHGGRIEVSSTLNQGTTFTVTLPVKPAESETKGATS